MNANKKVANAQGANAKSWVLEDKKKNKVYYINSDGTCTVVHEDAVEYKKENRLQ